MDQAKTNKLVAGIIAGDTACENEILKIFGKQVEWLVKRGVGCENPDWEDVFQNIFIDFFQRIRDDQFDPSKGTLGAFLQSTIHYKIMDYLKSPHHKRKKLYVNVDNIVLENPQKNPQKLLEEKEFIQNVKTAIASLKEPEKTFLYLKYFKGFTYDEISKEMGLQKDELYKLNTTALNKLKNKL